MQLVIAGHDYRIAPMSPWEAFHVMRRVSPLLVGAGKQLIVGASADSTEAKLAALLSLVLSDDGLRLSHILASLPDSEMDYVAVRCLRRASVRDAGMDRWFPLLPEGGDKVALSYDFITLPVILQVIAAVLRREIADFLAAGPWGSGPKGTEAPST
jgi:hypothetical protein